MTDPVPYFANLDCERRWAGRPPLPRAIAARVAAMSTLVRAFSDGGAVALIPIAEVDPGAISGVDLPPLELRAPHTPAPDDAAAWGGFRQAHAMTSAAPHARAVPSQPACAVRLADTLDNREAARDAAGDAAGDRDPRACDRAIRRANLAPPADAALARRVNQRFWAALLGERLGVNPDGTQRITRLAQLEAALARWPGRPWVCKAALTAAGRDRTWGHGAELSSAARAQIGQWIAECGGVVLEPWRQRIADVGITGAVGAQVWVRAPHRLVVDARGGFVGIDVDAHDLNRDESAAFVACARAVGDALAGEGFRGPFAVDGYVYIDEHGDRRLHPLCEVNARSSFGHVAWALAQHLGRPRLRVGKFDGDPLVRMAGGVRVVMQ